MAKILLVAPDDDEQRRMLQDLRRAGEIAAIVEDAATALAALEKQAPELVLVNLYRPVLDLGEQRDLIQACGGNVRIPAVGLLSEEQLATYDVAFGYTDFLLYPWRPSELRVRLLQALFRSGRLPQEGNALLRCGDLLVDTNRYEVFLSGQPVELTFKEYELLRFLATNPDKVFTRETLLNRVWGYDYYGGARTVDVHIRRLRSKIEDKDHVFIETVRNVGYRFRPGIPGE